MAKTTIYLNKEAQAVFDKAKEYAGDNLSSIIAQGLAYYVEKMEMVTRGMSEKIIFDGTEELSTGVHQGKNIKFVGLELSTGSTEYDDMHKDYLALYLTKKGKFLLKYCSENLDNNTRKHGYKVFESFSEVMQDRLPANMIEDAMKKMPEVTCEELDV